MKKNQSGRSMVEMLAVLAIIGFLSIGGIAGYSLAVNRIKVDKVLDLAGKLTARATGGKSYNNLQAAGLKSVYDVQMSIDSKLIICVTFPQTSTAEKRFYKLFQARTSEFKAQKEGCTYAIRFKNENE